MKKIIFLALPLLHACSTTCFVEKIPGTEQIDVFYSFGSMGDDMSEFLTEDYSESVNYENINNHCQKVSRYSFSKGPFLLDPNNISNQFCINCKPKCLIKLAKNDALKASGSLITSTTGHHIHGGYSTDITSYKCNQRFYEIRAIKHNKFKNENASEAGSDAAKTRRPF